jgi:hypothetical protein
MKPTREQELAVLQSVVYASLFDYPLTLDQLHATLVGVRADPDTIAAWWAHSALLQSAVGHRDGWYFPAGRSDLVATRARREALSRKLLDRDSGLLSLVAGMPFVRMVALSGSLAHLNAEGSADLDLFVITAPNRVWSVTVAAVVLSKLLGWRKRLCMNFVVSERAMKIAPEDLFSANQIIHLRPITGQSVFERFVGSNAFVRRFYPNFELGNEPGPHASASAADPLPRDAAEARFAPPSKSVLERALSLGLAQGAERVARALYGWHLRRRSATWQSRDQVRLEPECLKLHTSSHRASILARFERAMLDAQQAVEEDSRCEAIASRS